VKPGKFSSFWSSLSVLECVTFVVTLLLLLVWLAAVGDLIAARSLAGIAAGLSMLLLSSICLVCASCLIIRHLLRWRRVGAASIAVLIGGLAGAFPAAAIAIQLSGY
jgi:hypothetical protein